MKINNTFMEILSLTKKIFIVFLCSIILSVSLVHAQKKIKLKKSTVSKVKKLQEPVKEKKQVSAKANIPTRVNKSITLKKKNLWLAVGMSVALAGSGHFYVGKYSAGSIFLLGSYGLMGAGIISMLSAHSTRDIVVSGNRVREEDRNIKALSIVGGLFLASGLIFYVGSVVDIFLEVSEYNRRIERLQRYSRRLSNIFSTGVTSHWYVAQNSQSVYLGHKTYF